MSSSLVQASIVGPSEAGLSRARDRYRYVMYVKCREETILSAVKSELERISRDGKWEKYCSVQYDVDPVSGY